MEDEQGFMKYLTASSWWHHNLEADQRTALRIKYFGNDNPLSGEDITDIYNCEKGEVPVLFNNLFNE